jgi:hypothetical protein
LGTITDFKATSDLPQWWIPEERDSVRRFLETNQNTEKIGRYTFQIDGREVDFSRTIPIPISSLGIPVWLAKILGLAKIAWHQVLPAIWESRRS